MARIITGAAILVGEGIAIWATGGLAALALAPAWVSGLAASAALTAGSAILGGIANALQHGQGTYVNIKQPNAPWKIIYGRQRVRDSVILAVAESGDSNKYLHLILAHAAHQVQSLDALYLNGRKVFFDNGVDGFADHNTYHDLSYQKYNFHGRVYWERYNGTNTQAASAFFIANGPAGYWDPTCQLKGICYSYIRLAWDSNIFPGGLPTIAVDITGKNDIYDPRTGLSGYSENPALCINDFLCNVPYGMKAQNTVIPNQIQNGSFESNVGATPVSTPISVGNSVGDNWTYNSYSPTGTATPINVELEDVSALAERHGGLGLLFKVPASTTVHTGSTTIARVFNNAQIPVTPATTITTVGWHGIYYAGSLPAGLVVQTRVGVQFFDNTGTFISEDFGSIGTVSVLQYVTRTTTVPTGAVYAQVQAACVVQNGSGFDWLITELDIRLDDIAIGAVTPSIVSNPNTSEINETQLIAAANTCDEAVTLKAGGTELRYTCNGAFSLAQSRGDILNNLLNSCAGNITYANGQFSIWPATWRGSSGIQLDLSDFKGPLQFKRRNKRDLINAVRGNFVSPAGLLATNGGGYNPKRHPGEANVYDGQWALVDIPPYKQDTFHGYATDSYYLADGSETLYADMKFPFTLSSSMAQRLAKLTLERNRQQDSISVELSLNNIDIQPMDIVELTHAPFGWVNKLFEVTAVSWDLQVDSQGRSITPHFGVELQETASSVYAWSTSEELPIAANNAPAFNGGMSIEGPTNLVLESGSDTVGVSTTFTPAAQASATIQGIDFVAQQAGTGGNSVTVTFVGTTQTADNVAAVASGNAISVYIVKPGGATRTLADITKLFLNYPVTTTAGGLIAATLHVGTAGTTAATAASSTSLAGGTAPINTNTPNSGTTSWHIIQKDNVSIPRIRCRWTAPTDNYVLSGGQIIIQIQNNTLSETNWKQAGVVNGDVTEFFIAGVIDGDSYNVQIASRNSKGVMSDWYEVGPHVVSTSVSVFTSQQLFPNINYNQNNDATVDSIVTGGGASATVRVYGPGGVGTSWHFKTGSGSSTQTITVPSASITGIAFATKFVVYYDTIGTAYHVTTSYDNSLPDTNIVLGILTTVNSGGTGGVSGGGGAGGGGTTGGGGGGGFRGL